MKKLLAYELRKSFSGCFWLFAFIVLIALDAVLFLEPWNILPAKLNYYAAVNSKNRVFYDFLTKASEQEIETYFNETGFSPDMDFYDADMEQSANEKGRFLDTKADEYSALSLYSTFYRFILIRTLCLAS